MRSNFEAETEGGGIEIQPNKINDSPGLKTEIWGGQNKGLCARLKMGIWGSFHFETLSIPSFVNHGSTQNRSRARVDCS